MILRMNFGHILKANDMKHHINQTHFIILKAVKREMKTRVFLNSKNSW
jgi:hypothetical protein